MEIIPLPSSGYRVRTTRLLYSLCYNPAVV